MNKIGDRIKFIRKVNDLTQKEFCKKVGLSQGFLSNVEHNVYNLPIDQIIGIANIFGFSQNWLLTGEGEMMASSATPAPRPIPPPIPRQAHTDGYIAADIAGLYDLVNEIVRSGDMDLLAQTKMYLQLSVKKLDGQDKKPHIEEVLPEKKMDKVA